MIKGVLFQESLFREPFWMLVACCLVNRTRWMQAEPVFEQLKKRYPTPEALGDAPVSEIEDIVKPLGLYRRRALSIVTLAREYMSDVPPENAEAVLRLPGCGKYAADSWAIFVEGRRDVEPTDVELRAWLEKEKND